MIGQLTNAADIRARLECDRAWAAFSLADLDPGPAAYTSWFGPAAGTSVVLIYGAYDLPIVIGHGDRGGCERTIADPEVVRRTASAYLNVVPADLAMVGRQFSTFDGREMVRLLLDRKMVVSPLTPLVERLGPSDLGDLRRLYVEEPPAFFMPSQLRDGVYYGVREGHEIVAVAGTHVVSATASVGALGNVYTRRDRRRQGFAEMATRAVVAELCRVGITTIVLNIVAANDAARRVYERIGFREYCVYYEGVATR